MTKLDELLIDLKGIVAGLHDEVAEMEALALETTVAYHTAGDYLTMCATIERAIERLEALRDELGVVE